MKVAAVIILSFAVATIAFNTESKKQIKLPGQLTDEALVAAGIHEDDVSHSLPDQMARRGGKGKGEGPPPYPPMGGGWGWGPTPMIIPIPMIMRGWGSGYGGGYGGGNGGYGGGGYGGGQGGYGGGGGGY